MIFTIMRIYILILLLGFLNSSQAQVNSDSTSSLDSIYTNPLEVVNHSFENANKLAEAFIKIYYSQSSLVDSTFRIQLIKEADQVFESINSFFDKLSSDYSMCQLAVEKFKYEKLASSYFKGIQTLQFSNELYSIQKNFDANIKEVASIIRSCKK